MRGARRAIFLVGTASLLVALAGLGGVERTSVSVGDGWPERVELSAPVLRLATARIGADSGRVDRFAGASTRDAWTTSLLGLIAGAGAVVALHFGRVGVLGRGAGAAAIAGGPGPARAPPGATGRHLSSR